MVFSASPGFVRDNPPGSRIRLRVAKLREGFYQAR